MFTSTTTSVNSNLSQQAVVGALTNASDFNPTKAERIQKSKSASELVDKICSHYKYKNLAVRLILYALITLAENRGELFNSQQGIADEAKVSLRTVAEWLEVFLKDGLIAKERRGTGWQDRQTNRTILLFMQHWNPDVCAVVAHDKNLNKDLNKLRDQDQADPDSIKAELITKIATECKTKRQTVVKWASTYGLTVLYDTFTACQAYKPTKLGGYVYRALQRRADSRGSLAKDWQVRAALHETPKGKLTEESLMRDRGWH